MSPSCPLLPLRMGCLNGMTLGGSLQAVISSPPPPSSTALPLPRSGFVEPFLLPRRLPFISYFVLSKMSVLRMIHQEKNPFS